MSEGRTKRNGAIKLLLFAVAILGLFAAFKFLPLGDYVQQLVGKIESLGPWGPVAFIALYILATILMVPGTLLTLAAGYVFKLALGMVCVVVGSVAGAWAAFIIGRTFARGFVESQTQSYPRFAAIQRAVEESGFKIVMLTRLSPLFPFNALNYLFSVTSVRTRDYVLGSLIGMFPGTLMYVYFGAAVENVAQLASGDVEGGMAQQLLKWFGLLATIVVTVFITKEARRVLGEYADVGKEPSSEQVKVDVADQSNLGSEAT